MSGYACIMYIRSPRGLIDVENKKDGNSRATFYLIYVDMNQWVHIYNGAVESLFNVTVYLRINCRGMNIQQCFLNFLNSIFSTIFMPPAN